MMLAIYGNSYQILQGPGYVAIKYEMVNETRIIPLVSGTSDPHISAKIREYLGDARGHFEGNTLVTERFTPIGPNTVEWSVHFDDPHTWTPWTFAMNLTKVPSAQDPQDGEK